MRTSVRKWGNSLALRIPKALATESNIETGTSVDLSFMDGKIVVSPVAAKEYKLEELLARVTKQNIHREIDTGGVVGREVW